MFQREEEVGQGHWRKLVQRKEIWLVEKKMENKLAGKAGLVGGGQAGTEEKEGLTDWRTEE